VELVELGGREAHGGIVAQSGAAIKAGAAGTIGWGRHWSVEQRGPVSAAPLLRDDSSHCSKE
jgi:hypothetical protein